MTLNTSRNTLSLVNTPTLRLLILIPSRTHSQSQQNTEILVQQSTRITLVTEDNLKSIQAESYSLHFDQSKTLNNLSSLKNSKTLKKNLSKILKSQICFSENIQRCSLLSNLNKLLNCIKRLVKTFNDWSVSS